jgi:D-sedoheptulose 7-phosphate isomerase
MTLAEICRNSLSGLAQALEALQKDPALVDRLLGAGRMLAKVLEEGGVIYLCGNGGSAAEAQHFAAEFMGRFLMERPGLPAAALTCDTSILTALGNDYGFEDVFARQIRTLGRSGDLLWALSTSGTSPNVLKALAAARENGLRTLFMCGPKINDPLAAEVILPAPGASTPRIQEMHLFMGHLLCQLAETILFAGPED